MDYYYDYYNLVKSEMINVTFNLLKKKSFYEWLVDTMGFMQEPLVRTDAFI